MGVPINTPLAMFGFSPERKEIALYMRLPQALHAPTSVVSEANAVLAEGVALRTDKAEIRQVTEHDAVAIARYVYRVYGCTYLNENFYYPDRIADQLKAKKILAFGGFNADGELVCYQGVRRAARPLNRRHLYRIG